MWIRALWSPQYFFMSESGPETKEFKDFCFRQLALVAPTSVPSEDRASLQRQDHRAWVCRPDSDHDCPCTKMWALHPFACKAERLITISGMLESWCKLPWVTCLAQCLESSRQETRSSFPPLCLPRWLVSTLPLYHIVFKSFIFTPIGVSLS